MSLPDAPIRFHPAVVSDLREAIAWYGEISPELASRFRLMVNASLETVAQYPEMYAIVFDDVRASRVHRFPYLVQYRVVDGAGRLSQRGRSREMAQTGRNVALSTYALNSPDIRIAFL